MTYTTTCRLSAIADRNQFALKDWFYTSSILGGLFATGAVLLSQLF